MKPGFENTLSGRPPDRWAKLWWGVRMGVFVCGVMPVTGCVSVSTIVTVHANGSATIEETLAFSSQLVALFASVAKARFGRDKTVAEVFPAPDSTDVERRFGPGAKLLTSGIVIVEESGRTGRRSAYSIPSVDGLVLDVRVLVEEQAFSVDLGPPVEGDSGFRFGLKNVSEGISRITVQEPHLIWSDSEPADDERFSKEVLSFTQESAKGAEIRYVVKVEGEIVGSSVPVVSANAITLVSVEWARLVADLARTAQQRRPLRGQSLRQWLASCAGVTLSPSPETVIDFRSR
jgi:hypothetical protein